MSLYKAFRKKVGDFLLGRKDTDSQIAYNLWASTYDNQPENLIMHLNQLVFENIIDRMNIENKKVIDYGCGTGKYWEKIFLKKPSEITGYDTASAMLDKLHQKYPNASAYCLEHNKMLKEGNNSCDIIISSLVVAHIKDLKALFIEWNRILKNGGTVVITDFHPDALQKGATRCFSYNGAPIVINNYIYTLKKIRNMAKKLHWNEIDIFEKKVDDTVKYFYRTPAALEVFEATYDTKLLYALWFKKSL
ncbi:class I SAM-dependent methyltransferase [Arachidicoccus sp.]|uniref:class I SAM-dependent methyltransferase n=1 Tax=Arachidicoccus sp. TaxID=1872624 RepID=UPI003D251B62